MLLQSVTIIFYIHALFDPTPVLGSSPKPGHVNLRGPAPDLARWRWKCVNDRDCVRFSLKDGEDVLSGMDLDSCKSVCGPHGALFPHPSLSKIDQKVSEFRLDADSFKIPVEYQGNEKLTHLLNRARESFKSKLYAMSGSDSVSPQLDDSSPSWTSTPWIRVVPRILRPDDLRLDLDTAENYKLSVAIEVVNETPTVKVESQTVFGYLRALETLSQLCSYDRMTRTYFVASGVDIEDAPKFKYRGLLLDTGRNYFSVEAIERILDGLSYDKMNVLHWHMNEQQSFPFVSSSVPKLTKYGAYSKDHLYYPSDVRHLVRYAYERGVILLPEFDMPAHASFGWDWGAEAESDQERNMVLCQQKEWADGNWSLAAEPPSGQLNPINDRVYEILGKLFSDFIDAFNSSDVDAPVNLFHMGGDEVNFPCWGKDAGIVRWLEDNGYNTNPEINSEGFMRLWSDFQDKAREKLVRANGGKDFKHGTVVWTSDLAKGDVIDRYLPKEDYVIQVWCGGYDYWISDLLRKGYRVIFSNSDAWYLDCGFGQWLYSGEGADNNWCSPFKSWKTVYANSPRSLVSWQGLHWKDVGHLVWGGEAAMWTEQVDENAVESRVWPRLSAMAERLWSDPPSSKTWREAERRFIQHRHRIVQRGIRADGVQPEFCRLHDGWCFMPATKRGGGGFLDFGHDSESEWKDHPIEDGGDSMKSYPHSAFRDKRSSAFYATAVTLAMLGALAFVYRRILCGSVLALVNQMRAGKR